MYQDLIDVHYPGFAAAPHAVEVLSRQIVDNSANGEPSVGDYCVTFNFLNEVGNPTPVPSAVANAPVGSSSLVVRGDCACPPAPTLTCLDMPEGSLKVREDKPGKEQFGAKWGKGPALAGAAFGDPTVSGGTRYDVCVYDSIGALAGQYTIRRAGHTCDTKPCWKPVGGTPGTPKHLGYAYKDGLATADGLTGLVLKGGEAGKTKAIVKGKDNIAKGLTGLPKGVAAALAGSSSATVQLFGSDASACLSLSLPTVVHADGVRFEAKRK